MVRISTFAVEDSIVSSTESFEAALKQNNLSQICETRIAKATLDAEKSDWKVIKTLTSNDARKELVDYLGFSSQDDEAADGVSKLPINGDKKENIQTSEAKEPSSKKTNRLSAFFDNSADSDNFLSELAATKGAKTNNPFKMYSGSESESDRRITRALLHGEFEEALDVCLQENRMSDAFMIAICGGQHCIDKAQKAYFNQQAGGPNYLRLLASVVGKNLWDLVHNADLDGWKEVMVTLCTYADAKEFPDLCEALGDRLEEQLEIEGSNANLRKDACFCYVAGSKLEKVVAIWIAELQENEGVRLQDSKQDSSFSIHAHSLQSFIEKVTAFREITRYQDEDRGASSNWKLAALYEKYAEYADIASAHGQLQIAERYLDLLPSEYPAAKFAKDRVRQATRRVLQPAAPKQPSNVGRTPQRVPQSMPDFQQQQGPANPIVTSGRKNTYAPASSTQPQNPYAPTNGQPYGPSGYQNPNAGYDQIQQQLRAPPGVVPPPSYGAYQNQPLGPPPRNVNTSPSIPPPSQGKNMSNWNDTPADFFKAPTSRRGTPGVGSNASPAFQPNPQPSNFGPPPKSTPPQGPPPKAGSGPPPPQMSSPPTNTYQSHQQPERPSSAANTYAPQQASSNLSVQQRGAVPRGPSPYNAPPSAAPPSNRYAPAQPAPSNQPESSMMSTSGRQAPPPPSSNPYAPRQNHNAPQQNAIQQPPPFTGLPPQSSNPPSGPPQSSSQDSRPDLAQAQQRKPASLPPKYGQTCIPFRFAPNLC